MYRALTGRCGSAEVTNMEDKCVCWMWKEWISQTLSPVSLSATLKFDALPWFLMDSTAIYQIATTLHTYREGCLIHWACMMRHCTQWHRTELRMEGSSPKLEERGQKLEGRDQKLEGKDQKLEGRDQKLEGREQKLEGRGQKLEERGQKSE